MDRRLVGLPKLRVKRTTRTFITSQRPIFALGHEHPIAHTSMPTIEEKDEWTLDW